MPDDIKTQQIEKRIDRDVAGGLSIVSGAGTMTIAPRNMGELMEFAKLMAVAGDCIRPAFRGNAGACLSLCLQAFRWGADPFAVANKAYITTGKAGTQIAYESQLIHAIVNSSPMLARRLRARYEGAGAQRKCIVSGVVRGEEEPFEYESPTVAQIAVKNSPLWQGDPDQQLFYYATRAWARRYLPEVLLGIYTPDEVQGEIIDMTPQQGAVQEAVAAVEQPIPWEVYDAEGECYQFERSNSAIEACRKILIASAADPAKLATAWENNAGFLLALCQEGLQPEAQGIERLYAELMPEQKHEIGQPPVIPAASEASGDAVDGEGSARPPAPSCDDTLTTESPADAQPRKEVTGNGLAGQNPRPSAPAGEPDQHRADRRAENSSGAQGRDLLGDRPGQNLTVPWHPQDGIALFIRQFDAMLAEAPLTAKRASMIRLRNANQLQRLEREAPAEHARIWAALAEAR